MKDRIRSFMVFTTPEYRVLAFVIAPVIGIVFGHLVAAFFGIPGYVVTGFLLIPLELILDYLIFGGICAKEVTHLEYLKGSTKGEVIIKRALIGGMIRMLLTMGLIFIGNQISFQILYPEQKLEMNAVVMLATLLLLSYAVMMAGVMIGRFFDSLQVYYVLSLVAMAAEGLMFIFLSEYRMPAILTAVVLVVGLTTLSVKIALKHVKESYYDKTVTDGD